MPDPDFGEIFPPHAPCPKVTGFLFAQLHCPCRVSDKDSAPREGTASEVDGADGEGSRAGFGGMALGSYSGCVHGAEASPSGGSGRGDPAFRVTGEGSDPPAETSFFFLKMYQKCKVRVFAKSNTRKK